MLSVGIDTHERIHYAEIQDEKENRLWHGKIINLNTTKSDSEDTHILAATPWHDPPYREYTSHNRPPLLNISRERSIVVKSIAAINNYIYRDLTAVFPEFTDLYGIDSAAWKAILYEYATPCSIINTGIDNSIKLIKKASKGHYRIEG